MKFSLAATAVAFVTTLSFSSAAQTQATKAYVLEFQGQKLTQSNPDGSGRTVLFSGLAQINTIAVDHALRLMYWTNTSSGLIQRATTNGLQLQTLMSGLRSPRGIAIDPVDGKLYWGEQDLPLLKRANLADRNHRQRFERAARGWLADPRKHRCACTRRDGTLAARGRIGAPRAVGAEASPRARLMRSRQRPIACRCAGS